MNFQEYINQKDPQRRYFVEVKESDCLDIIFDLNQWLILLQIGEDIFAYAKRPDSNLLYTMDEDRNVKGVSCFVWRGENLGSSGNYLLTQNLIK
ncbi:MAG: hypothetical protein KDC67_10460 [Ignavibacteriae bacterium]|nr:hypothetical protein [Ignavibacteriota bacterium]